MATRITELETLCGINQTLRGQSMVFSPIYISFESDEN